MFAFTDKRNAQLLTLLWTKGCSYPVTRTSLLSQVHARFFSTTVQSVSVGEFKMRKQREENLQRKSKFISHVYFWTVQRRVLWLSASLRQFSILVRNKTTTPQPLPPTLNRAWHIYMCSFLFRHVYKSKMTKRRSSMGKKQLRLKWTLFLFDALKMASSGLKSPFALHWLQLSPQSEQEDMLLLHRDVYVLAILRPAGGGEGLEISGFSFCLCISAVSF